jgi:hypothetical protein
MVSPHWLFGWLMVMSRLLNVTYSIQPNIQCEPVDRIMGGQNYPCVRGDLSFREGNDCSISRQAA